MEDGDDEIPAAIPPRQTTFKRNPHAQYFLRCLRALPTQAEGHDGNRVTIAYFCLSGLDLLGILDTQTTTEQRAGWTEWIWRLQSDQGGFRGSTYMDTPRAKGPAHLPSTYTAILCLAILRAPMDRLDIPGLRRFLRSCQASDGSFSPIPLTEDEKQSSPASMFENDARMTYCASVVRSLIGGDCFDINSAKGFADRCRTWEGGYASRAGVIEAQGGTTYCNLAALSLLHGTETRPLLSRPESDETLRWLLQRQIGGFQGRPGKLEDVCYSFWVGAAITVDSCKILGCPNLIEKELDKAFLLSAQSPIGGFGKDPESFPDPFHSYLAIAALALSHAGELDLKPLHTLWNVSMDTAAYLKAEMERIGGKA